MMTLTRQYQKKTRTKQRKSGGNAPQWTTLGKAASYRLHHENALGLYNLCSAIVSMEYLALRRFGGITYGLSS
jgi:hypothetical protein